MTAAINWDRATPPDLLEAGMTALQHIGCAHLVPLLAAVRECGISLMQMPQGCSECSLPDAPWAARFGDGPRPPPPVLGPSGISAELQQHVLCTADTAIIVACEPLPDLYMSAAVVAGYWRKNSVLVDTRPAFEIPWLEACQACIRGLILCGTVQGGRA